MKTKLLIAIVLLQAAWVVGTSVYQEYLLRAKPQAQFETQPNTLATDSGVRAKGHRR